MIRCKLNSLTQVACYRGDGAAVTDELEKLGGDEGDGFGVVEAHTAGESLLGEEAGVVQLEFFEFSGCEVHGSPFAGPGE